MDPLTPRGCKLTHPHSLVFRCAHTHTHMHQIIKRVEIRDLSCAGFSVCFWISLNAALMTAITHLSQMQGPDQ